MRLRYALVIILAFLAALPQPIPAHEVVPADSDTQATLGPVNLSGLRVESIAVSPGWPEERTFLLLRQMGWSPDFVSDLARSRDGGATWQWLRAPAMNLTSVTLAPSPAGDPLAFALGRNALFRSSDVGSTWQTVAEWPEPSRTRTGMAFLWPPVFNSLTLSPAFGDDGVGFLLAAGRLLRSDDAGLSWQPVSLAEGQWAQQVAFSPDFAHDWTVYLASVSGGFPSVADDIPVNRDSTDHEDSLGVLVSTDGGESWSATSQGLEVDGVPYRHVQQIVPSPTFADDGTLFAFAWGPRKASPTFPYRSRSAALFRNRDRGGTCRSTSKSCCC